MKEFNIEKLKTKFKKALGTDRITVSITSSDQLTLIKVYLFSLEFPSTMEMKSTQPNITLETGRSVEFNHLNIKNSKTINKIFKINDDFQQLSGKEKESK